MAVDDRSLAEVVTDLEVRLAFQDRALQALDDVVRTLYARVESTEKALKDLRETADAALEPVNEPPPHY